MRFTNYTFFMSDTRSLLRILIYNNSFVEMSRFLILFKIVFYVANFESEFFSKAVGVPKLYWSSSTKAPEKSRCPPSTHSYSATNISYYLKHELYSPKGNQQSFNNNYSFYIFLNLSQKKIFYHKCLFNIMRLQIFPFMPK